MTDDQSDPLFAFTSRGSLISFAALDCGHAVQCYSLEPTPILCDECANKERKVLADIVADIRGVDTDDLVSQDDLGVWLDECGIVNQEMRADITRIADLCDDIRSAVDSAERYARSVLDKYPPREAATP